MLRDELELLLLGGRPLDQLANRSQSIRPVRLGNLTSLLDRHAGMPLRQADQPLQHTYALDAARLHHRLTPPARMGSDQAGLRQQPRSATFHVADLL